MKRHTRSSRSTEDALHGNLSRAERNTRSRTSSEDLVIHELPKITRSRKSLPTQNVTEGPKQWVERRTRHSSGGKLRMGVGSAVTGQSKSLRTSAGSVLPHTSDRNDGHPDHNKLTESTPSSKLLGAHGKLPKMSLRRKNDKDKKQDNSKSQKILENTPEVNERISKVAVPSLVGMRTRHNSGKSSGLKRSGQNKNFDQTVARDSSQGVPDDKGDENVHVTSSVPLLSDNRLSTIETSSGKQNNLKDDVPDGKTTNSDLEKNEKIISVEVSNAGKHDTQEKNVLTGRRISPRKLMPEIESTKVECTKLNSTSSAKVDKPLSSSNSMQSESKESKQETSKRKTLVSTSEQKCQKDDKITESSEPQRKRHRTLSASRSLQAEFDNVSTELTTSKSEADFADGSSVSKHDSLGLNEKVVEKLPEKPENKSENKSDVLVTTVPTLQNPDALGKVIECSDEVEIQNSPCVSNTPCASSYPTESNLEEVESVPETTPLPFPVKVRESLQPSESSVANISLETTGDLQGHTAKLDGNLNKIKEKDKISNKPQQSVSEINNDRTASEQVNVKSNSINVVPPSKSGDPPSKNSGNSLASTSSGYSSDVQVHPATSEKKTSQSESSSQMENDVESQSSKQLPLNVGFEAPEWCQEVDEGEPFFFESDHLALKGNKDYRMLLRTLTTLEAQRKKAAHDLETLVNRQKQALANPISFVNKIQHNVDLNLPVPQRVVPLPEVNWEVYLGKPENSELLLTVANQKIKTRPSNSASVIDHHNCICCKKNGSQECKKSDHHLASTSGVKSGNGQASTSKSKLEPKSETFNLPWTIDEQRKLEELLVKYPMEAVEARRWEKIARELGNRTPLQVASRVQKYFIKLTRAGLPVPGRLPHSVQLTGNKKSRRAHPFMRPVPSTFLQSVVPPVYMNENDSWDSMDGDFMDEEPSDDESIPAELQETEEYKELKRLKQLKREKLRQQSQMTHSGYQCDKCGVEPIVGTRWHCSDCPSSTSTDLCQKCMDSDDYRSFVHSSTHHLEPIRFKMEATYIDNDYTRFQQQQGPYNYLDPNYTPENQPDL